MTTRSLKKPVMLWLLANLFFAFQFILRIVPNLLRDDIMQRFAVDAAGFGSLVGYYYLGYAGAQIPLGLMLDRLSFRFVTSFAVITASLGALLFASTDSWKLLLLSRVLIGAGSGVAFLSVAKITKTYFDEKYHSLLLGLSFSFGLLGGVFGSTPMYFVFNIFGVEQSLYVLAIAGFTIASIIFLLGKIENNDQSKETAAEVGKMFLSLISNPTILLIGISGGLMVGSLEGFIDAWATPFFNQIFGMDEVQSTAIPSFVYIGMCFGGPVLALAAALLRSVHSMIVITGILTILVFGILFYLPPLSFIMSSALMLFLGVLCCYQVLVFTVVSNQIDSSSAGLAIAIINCINMSFGSFFHSVIGRAFVASWDGSVNKLGNAIYTIDNFIYALAVIPICCFIGIFGFAYLALRGDKASS